MSNETMSIETMKSLFSEEQLKALGQIIQAEQKNTTKKVKAVKLPTIKARSDLPCTAVVGDYKGKATITLSRGESSFINKPFTFGKAKAQMIVEQYEAIKKFAEQK